MPDPLATINGVPISFFIDGGCHPTVQRTWGEAGDDGVEVRPLLGSTEGYPDGGLHAG